MIGGFLFITAIVGTIIIIYFKKKKDKVSEVKALKDSDRVTLDNTPGPVSKVNYANEME